MKTKKRIAIAKEIIKWEQILQKSKDQNEIKKAEFELENIVKNHKLSLIDMLEIDNIIHELFPKK